MHVYYNKSVLFLKIMDLDVSQVWNDFTQTIIGGFGGAGTGTSQPWFLSFFIMSDIVSDGLSSKAFKLS